MFGLLIVKKWGILMSNNLIVKATIKYEMQWYNMNCKQVIQNICHSIPPTTHHKGLMALVILSISLFTPSAVNLQFTSSVVFFVFFKALHVQ